MRCTECTFRNKDPLSTDDEWLASPITRLRCCLIPPSRQKGDERVAVIGSVDTFARQPAGFFYWHGLLLEGKIVFFYWIYSHEQ